MVGSAVLHRIVGVKAALDHMSAIAGAVLFFAGATICGVLLVRGGPSMLWVLLGLFVVLSVTSVTSLVARGRDRAESDA